MTRGSWVGLRCSAPSGPVVLGSRVNDYLSDKTSGAGGDYPDGIVRLGAGTYYWDELDLSPGNGYVRAFDATKPNNNHLTVVENDGPGTVIFDLRPESAATARGQTQTAAYNDLVHGGGIRNKDGTSGSLRWIFDGAFIMQDGGIHFTNQVSVNCSTTNGVATLSSSPGSFKSWWVGWELSGTGVRGTSTILSVASDGSSVQMSLPAYADEGFTTVTVISPGVDHVIWHGVQRRFKITEWRRQYDFIASLRGLSTVGVSLPDDYPSTGPYTQVWFDARFKGNTFTTGFRLEGCTKMRVIRADVGPVGDDAMFTGDRSSDIDVIGSAFHEFDNSHDSYGGASASQGPLVTNRMHNDGWQATGVNNRLRWLDSTCQGHAFEWVTDDGDLNSCVADRLSTGVTGAAGGDIGVVNGHHMDSTNKVGSGAPTTRLSGHFWKTFSNGTDHVDGELQNAYAISGGGANWHTGLVAITGASYAAAISNASVAVPTGVTVDANGFMTSSLSSFLNSTDAPHKVFQAAYGAGELAAVLTDYGIPLD